MIRQTQRALLLAVMLPTFALAQSRPAPKGFSWVSPGSEKLVASLSNNLRHRTFMSPSMGMDVGYYVYLPPGYYQQANKNRRYPVVYNLHGGRPGGEYKMVAIHRFVDAAIRDGKIEPVIYVFPNGGPMSWYNYPQFANGRGEDVFVKETIPHIDKQFRTIARREGRGVQGYSQGGRGTTRIMFKYPELFGSAAPGGSGYATEKRIQENDGVESEYVKFTSGYNTWDLAKRYAARKDAPPLRPLIWVGSDEENYPSNLEFIEYLEELKIPYQKLVAPGIEHNARQIYEIRGDQILKFHDANFKRMLKN